MAWGPVWNAFVPGEGPDPFAVRDALRQRGIETTLVDPHRRPLNPFAGRNTLLEALDPLRALRVLTRGRRADLVVCVFEGPALPLLLLRRLVRFRAPIVLWDIGLTEGWRLRERVLDAVVPRVDGILVLSESQAPYIRRRWGESIPVEVIHHHIDATFYRATPINDTGPVLSVGDDVGRDFQGLNEAARGLDVPIGVKTRWRVASAALELAPNVSILDRWMSPRELRSIYEQARIVVVPLKQTLNASGVSTILEAMAMNRQLVVSDSRTIRDFIVPGETCLTVPCGDPDALRAAIARLLAEPETAARLAANGRRLVEERFASPVFADAFARVLRRIAEGSPPP